MTIITVFKEANRNKACYFRALQYLLIAGLASVSPLLLTALIYPLFRIPLSIGEFIAHGEAGIIAIGILLWAGILIARELKPPFAHRVVFQMCCFALGVVAVIIYACVRISPAVNKPIDDGCLLTMSFAVWIVSLLFGFLVVLVDAVREGFDPIGVRKAQFESLSEEFEDTTNEQ